MLKGLFIGIDRFASRAIPWLSCARKDAVALHALFTDTLGGETVLLTDNDAIRANIEQQFARLAASDPEDLVVIAFSGHGSETQDLITYDAEPTNLSGTAIHLDTLTEWFARIPARNLVFFLDCCFSGGMGAKAFKVDVRPRDLQSTDDLLKQLSGDGRLILTASLATEQAWENQRFGHGLLTYHVLEALQGVEEVVQGGKLAVYRLLEYVTQRVIDGAAQLRKDQHPTLRGTLNGELTWPIFRPGKHFHAAFPERRPKIATAELKSLSLFGFPAEIVTAWAGSIGALNSLQLDALNEYRLLDGEHIVVSAPTSSGKTMIGELAAINGSLERRRALFLFPLKALVNDKFRHFNHTYGPFGLRTIRATGDSSTDEIVPLMRGQYDICLMTYEKCAALLLGSPHILEQVGTVVVDEVQMITDPSRGVNLEFLLTLFKLRRRQGLEPQMISLSAVIGDTNGLERWLGGRLLLKRERPIPLDEGVINSNGTFRYIDAATNSEVSLHNFIRPEMRKGSSQDLIVPLVRKLAAEGKSVIVFRETKGEARGCARYLAAALALPPATTAIEALPTGDPSLSSVQLREALQSGVAFHIADLDADERQIIEENFRTPGSALRVIAATTTLAMGVNTPTEAVIIAGLDHPGEKPYSIAEYKNIVGRAGRLGHSKRGTSYLVALTPKEEHYLWNRYVSGSPEAIESRIFANDTDARTLVLRVLVTAEHAGGTMTLPDIVGFLEESFGAFQQKRKTPLWNWDRMSLEGAINDLHLHKLIETSAAGSYRLTELGRLSGVSGVEVESIVRVVDALNGIDSTQINDPALIAATQVTVELDQVLFPINRRSTEKEPQTWISEIRRQDVPQGVLRALHSSVLAQHQPTLRAKKAVACLLWVSGKRLAEMEQVLTQFGGAFDGAAGPIRNVCSRTCDVLPTVGRIAEILNPQIELQERIGRLLVRLARGIPASAVDLAVQLGDRLNRGDYLSLASSGLCDSKVLENSPDQRLLNCIGGSRSKLSELREAAKQLSILAERPNLEQPIVPPYRG